MEIRMQPKQAGEKKLQREASCDLRMCRGVGGGALGSSSCENSAFLLESESRRVPGRQEGEGHPALSQEQLRQRPQHSVLDLGPPASPSQTPQHLRRVPRAPSGPRDPHLALPGSQKASLSPDGLSNSGERAFSSTR